MCEINDKKVIDINKYPRTVKLISCEELLAKRKKRRKKLIAEALLRIEEIRNKSNK
jgi:hypothetical protein